MGFTPFQAASLGLVRTHRGWEQAKSFGASQAASSHSESDLHESILEFCRSRGWRCVHSRMDRPSTCEVGTPDFAIAMPNGRTVWIEAKAGKGKLTLQQRAWLTALNALGHTTAVVRSMDEFLSVVNQQTK